MGADGDLLEERLRKLSSFGHFTSTKLEPLDLENGKDNSKPQNEIMKNNVKDDESKSSTATLESSGTSKENVSPDTMTKKRRISKQEKSLNKLYKAYSAKIKRKHTTTKIEKPQDETSNNRSENDEDDPFRFVQSPNNVKSMVDEDDPFRFVQTV